MLAAEIVGHLRSYQILGTLDYAADSSEPVAQALRESMTQEVERIFRLLKLLSPAYDIESAYVGLQSAKRDIHDNALEFLENILKPQLRTLLLPLLDSDFTAAQRVELANRTLGTTVPRARRRRRCSPRAAIPGSSRAPRTPSARSISGRCATISIAGSMRPTRCCAKPPARREAGPAGRPPPSARGPVE